MLRKRFKGIGIRTLENKVSWYALGLIKTTSRLAFGSKVPQRSSWLITWGVDASPLGGTSLRNEGRDGENCREPTECLIGSASVSGVHAHRWGSERATQSHSDTRSATGDH